MEELVYACQSRGIRISTRAEMRKALEDWILLSLDKSIPSSLLILSRAFTYTNSSVESEEAIKLALGILPDDVVEEVALAAPSSQDTDINVRKYESLKRQEKRILEEEQKKKEQVVQPAAATVVAPPQPETATITAEETAQVVPTPKEQVSVDKQVTSVDASKKIQEEEEMQKDKEFLMNMNEILTTLASGSSLEHERAELNNMVDVHIETVGHTSYFTDESINKLNKLNSKIGSYLDKLRDDINSVDQEIGTELKLLDKDNDGQITVQELADALQLLKEKPNDETIQQIINDLDRDNDGKISVRELLLGLKNARMKRDL